MPKVNVNEIDMYYEVMGTGEPLLLIAGFACDHTIWMEVAAPLAKEYQVIVFDNRGMGRSSYPETGTSLRQMADDAKGLLDALGFASVHVAGHSMGGMIAQELALAHPQKVRSLMLLSSCAITDSRGKAIIELWGDLPTLVDPRTMTNLLLPWMYTNAFYTRPQAIETLIAKILANPFPPSLKAIHDQSRAISSCNTYDRLKGINCPTLVLVGSEDILLPVGSSKILADGIRGSKLVILNKTGHGLLIESAEVVAIALLEFLKNS